MTRRGAIFLALGVLTALVAGGAGWWLSQNLVQRQEDVVKPYGEAARRNPFYAADRLLTRLGLVVHSVRRLTDALAALDAADTVLLATPTDVLSAAEAERLLAWVGQGGHLLVGVRRESQPDSDRDPLLSRLAVSSRRVEPAAADPVAVQPDPAAPALRVRFHSSLRLNDAPWRQARWGQGRVTLLTDIELFANERLAEHDHAEFLWALVGRDAGGEVWLQYQTLLPSLAQRVWQSAWMPLLGLILTLSAALWHYSRRLGPLLTPRSGEQRRLAEHLSASSRFLWRHGAGPMLLQAARHYTLRRLERRHPDAADALAAVLTDSDQPLPEAALVRTVQTLQRLNRSPFQRPP